MTNDLDVLIDVDGNISFVYSDDLAEVFAGEPQETRRVSHVEPLRGGWAADMSPIVGAPLVLGENGATFVDAEDWRDVVPFKTRQAALDAERSWLREHRGL